MIASRLFPPDGDDEGGLGLGLVLNPGPTLFVLTAELLLVSGVVFVAARLAVRFGPATNASMNAVLGGLAVLVLVSTGLHHGSSGSLAFFFVISTPIALLYGIAMLVVARLAREAGVPN